jgi:hypothetical protein
MRGVTQDLPLGTPTSYLSQSTVASLLLSRSYRHRQSEYSPRKVSIVSPSEPSTASLQPAHHIAQSYPMIRHRNTRPQTSRLSTLPYRCVHHRAVAAAQFLTASLLPHATRPLRNTGKTPSPERTINQSSRAAERRVSIATTPSRWRVQYSTCTHMYV